MTKDMYHIAMFVGAALNHPLPPCNGRGNISTIRVNQYKTKFSDIRIYCELANTELIEEYWSSLGKEGKPTEEFKLNCLIHDAKHYRECYLSMANMLTDIQTFRSLIDPASYPELLFSNLGLLDDFLNKNLELSKQSSHYMTNYYNRWRVDDFASLRKLLCGICNFKETHVV